MTTELSVEVKDWVQQWLRFDPDDSTRKEILELQAQGDEAELRKRLQTRIAFGTAGLRARMGAGFAYMNTLTVTQASQVNSTQCTYVDPQRCMNTHEIGAMDWWEEEKTRIPMRHDGDVVGHFPAVRFLGVFFGCL